MDLTPEYIEEANRLHWIVKGHLIPLHYSEKDIISIYDSYTLRIWGNIEAYVHEEGFEEVWAERIKELYG